jgi:antitoxin (DNA-binding transcriptional repressor) of toxin-antitoxin stability system
MHNTIVVGKREFIQHTSKYLKLAEDAGEQVIITHQGKPVLHIEQIKHKSIDDLKGIIVKVKLKGDINDHILPGFDQW